MTLSLATWNINSVRLRLPLVEQFVQAHNPDILCLQEIKCASADFPEKALRKIGFEHFAVAGQKGYHGVAILSRVPLDDVESRDVCQSGEARHVQARITAGNLDFLLHNFYVPAGGDEPDPNTNPKFAHKLAFIDEMKQWLTGVETDQPAILVGDLNIAPLETDVWSHKQLLKVVSHTPVETEGLEAVRSAGGWTDVIREFIPPEEKLYTWWSYRARAWDQSDRGRRLDHIWATPKVARKASDLQVLRDARGWERPSDHIPVIVKLKTG